MNYEDIIAGFRSLQASDFDYNTVDSRGWERLAELTDALLSGDGAEKAIPELFSVMERLPDADLGSPFGGRTEGDSREQRAGLDQGRGGHRRTRSDSTNTTAFRNSGGQGNPAQARGG